jgi:hypothetical protein
MLRLLTEDAQGDLDAFAAELPANFRAAQTAADVQQLLKFEEHCGPHVGDFCTQIVETG